MGKEQRWHRLWCERRGQSSTDTLGLLPADLGDDKAGLTQDTCGMGFPEGDEFAGSGRS